MGYRTMTREDAAILQQQQQISGNVTPSAQTPTSQSNQNISQSPPTPQGHHRTSRLIIMKTEFYLQEIVNVFCVFFSAPPAPQPPPMSMAPQIYNQGNVNSTGGILQPQQPPSQQPQYHPPQVATQHHPVYSSHTAQPVNNSYPNQVKILQCFIDCCFLNF